MQEPALKNKFGKQKGNNTITQHAVDDIIPQEKETLIVKYETYENIDDEVNTDDLYKPEDNITDEKKQRKCTFESDLKSIYDTKIPNGMHFIHANEVNRIY